MTKSLTKYTGSPAFWIVGAILIGVIVWLVIKDRNKPIATQYMNTETWDVDYNQDGLPTRITIHRDARSV